VKNVWIGRMAALGIGVAALGTHNAYAAKELVVNGGFEQVSMATPQQMNTTNVTGWSTTGYNFIYFPGTAATGSNGQYGNMSLWSPGNGSNNGLPATSPAGGNFVAADGAFEVDAISQTLNGLVAGGKYAVSFDWAAAQQQGFSGATTEQWTVSLGNQTQSTVAYPNANHGFSGWMQQTFTFQATAASELLSFLAVGTPNGEPPFSLLDGVSATAVPEPATWALMAAGLVGLGALTRRFRVRRTSHATT